MSIIVGLLGLAGVAFLLLIAFLGGWSMGFGEGIQFTNDLRAYRAESEDDL